MRYIKRLPHYMYSMYYDIRKYEFVKKNFMSFLGYVAIGWIASFAMFGITFSDGTYINPFFPAVTMTIGFSLGWIVLYYFYYYPMIQEVYKEIEMQDKYPFLYNKFIKIK